MRTGLFASVICLLATCATSPSDPGEDPPDQISIPTEITFVGAGGEPVQVPAGDYRVQAEGEKAMRLFAANGPSRLVRADRGAHSEDITTPTAVTAPWSETEYHVVLFQPDQTTLDAGGTLGGVMPRGGWAARTQRTTYRKQMSRLAVRKSRLNPAPRRSPAPQRRYKIARAERLLQIQVSKLSFSKPHPGSLFRHGEILRAQWTRNYQPPFLVEKAELMKGSSVVHEFTIGGTDKDRVDKIVEDDWAGWYTVRVSATDGSYSVQSSPFEIAAPSRIHLSALSKQAYSIGSKVSIKWRTEENDYVTVRLLRGAQVVAAIASDVQTLQNFDQTVEWEIPLSQAKAKDYRIKVTGQYTGWDRTADFAITGPTVRLSYPNGGEDYEVQGTNLYYGLEWTTGFPDGSKFVVELLRGGVVDKTIHSNYVKADEGKFIRRDWYISSFDPGPNPLNFKIRARNDVTGATVTSAAPFSIYPKTVTSLAVQAPAAGAAWQVGSSQTIMVEVKGCDLYL